MCSLTYNCKLGTFDTPMPQELDFNSDHQVEIKHSNLINRRDFLSIFQAGKTDTRLFHTVSVFVDYFEIIEA